MSTTTTANEHEADSPSGLVAVQLMVLTPKLNTVVWMLGRHETETDVPLESLAVGGVSVYEAVDLSGSVGSPALAGQEIVGAARESESGTNRFEG